MLSRSPLRFTFYTPPHPTQFESQSQRQARSTTKSISENEKRYRSRKPHPPLVRMPLTLSKSMLSSKSWYKTNTKFHFLPNAFPILQSPSVTSNSRKMAWSLVCPANRGIGFYLTRHLLQNTQIPVVATSRKDVEGTKKSILTDLDVDPKRLTVLEVDVTSKWCVTKYLSVISNLPHKVQNNN